MFGLTPRPLKVLERELMGARTAFKMAGQLPSSHQQHISSTASADVPSAARAAASAGYRDKAAAIIEKFADGPTQPVAGVTWAEVIAAARASL
jgi:hypothetical protein